MNGGPWQGPAPVRRRLLALGALGVVLTFVVAASALECLVEVEATNRELVTVSLAQRYHQDADMMHDALRADVTRAVFDHSPSDGVRRPDPAAVRDELRRHASRLRADLRDARDLQLPPHLERAFAVLRPAQHAYVAEAQRVVRMAFHESPGTAAADVEYQRTFVRLTRWNAAVTDALTDSAQRAQARSEAETDTAIGSIGTSSMAAFGGWVAALVWLNRSVGGLHGALLREAEQRSAATLLQRSLLPTEIPSAPGVRIAAASQPGQSGNRVGGDWYDVIPLPSGHLGLVIGDVVGHDLPAAARMGQLRNALRAYAVEADSPATVLCRLNRAAYLLDVADLATCLYADVDPTTLTVRWASAGHLPPLVAARTDEGRLLTGEPGPPLGVVPSAEYADHELRLDPGDTLVLYTDGLVERPGEPIDTGLTALASATTPQPTPEALRDHLMTSLLGPTPRAGDDVTMLLIQVAGPHAGPDVCPVVA